jgi:hypothetical protein
MRILFDQGVPRGLGASLRGHQITEARQLRWERISNGELLTLAESAGFHLLLTTDKNVRYQQNLSSRNISLSLFLEIHLGGWCGSTLTRLLRP